MEQHIDNIPLFVSWLKIRLLPSPFLGKVKLRRKIILLSKQLGIVWKSKRGNLLAVAGGRGGGERLFCGFV